MNRVLLLGFLVALASCDRMRDQPRVDALEATSLFADGHGSRDAVAGTVPRDAVDDETTPERSPFPWTKEFVERGRGRYEIFCAPCHDRAGTGGGMIVLRGFPRPRALQTDEQRALSDRRIHDVVADGVGTMSGFRGRVPARDRWAIVAYVRALQLAGAATLEDLPSRERERLEGLPR